MKSPTPPKNFADLDKNMSQTCQKPLVMKCVGWIVLQQQQQQQRQRKKKTQKNQNNTPPPQKKPTKQ